MATRTRQELAGVEIGFREDENSPRVGPKRMMRMGSVQCSCEARKYPDEQREVGMAIYC